ncbi:MAG TPA: transglycosylase SLT domain-containing protein [Steroidobacteraceae bacterium]|nr:transglycosylase SLT domain-containing protein [Steroidobacteraceae bacterium]
MFVPRGLLPISVVFALVMAIASARAADNSPTDVRAEFQRAYVLASNSSDSTDADSARLREYMLYPYLEQLRIRRMLASATSNFAVIDLAVETFLRAHDKEAVSAELRRAWYASLAKRQEWERLLANYRDVNDATLQCYALAARVALKRFDGLQSAVIAAWSNAPESRQACDPAFNWLRSQSALTDSLIEMRARLALNAGNVAFGRQLIAMLPKNLAEPLDVWATLIEHPRIAIDAAISSPKKAIEPAALLDGWTRLVRGDAGAAMERYKPLTHARKLSVETASRFAVELALALAWNRRSEALDYFAKVRAADLDDRAAEWYARAALWNGNWKRAAAVIEAMSPTLRQQTKWRYWSARVAELRGKRDVARAQYSSLLTDDNYYAALAAGRLKKGYAPQPKALAINEEQVQTIAAQPTFLRARELLQYDVPEIRNYAYDEWRRGYASLDATARIQAIAVASLWGWYDQAILTAAQQNQFDDYELLYPHPFHSIVQEAADIVKLPSEIIYATLRQESLYRVDAQSSAGAKGLMQLVPDTARRTARRWTQISAVVGDPKNLFDPTTNIYIGAARLRDLVDRFDGKTPVALAAYNAGAVAVERWFPKSKIDVDIWVENIPYNETRVYVQRILWHSVVFGWLASHTEQNTVPWLTDIRG